MSNKNIIFTSPCVAELIDLDLPVCGDNEVIVKLEVSTISAGTERANLVGDPNVSPTKSVVFPRQVGYSSSGIICQVGKNVSKLQIGDRVACSWSKHAQYCVMKEKNITKLDERISLSDGALLHIATFPLAAIRKCRLEVGESAIVMGLGVLGLVAVELLRASGAVPIIAVDPNPDKRKLALSLGADFALDPFENDFAEQVKAITNGGVKVAIEVTGKGQGLDMVLDCMARFGRVALLGCTRNSDFTIDYYKKVHFPGITLVGAHTMARPKFESSDGWWTEKDDIKALIDMLLYKRINISRLVEATYSPEDAPEVYTRLANDPVFPIVQFDWSRLK